MMNYILNESRAMLHQALVKTQQLKEASIESGPAANSGQFEISPSHGRRLRRQRRQARSRQSSVGGWVVRTW